MAKDRFLGIRDSVPMAGLIGVLAEKYKNKPWLLEDKTGQFQCNGQLEGSQSTTYCLLMLQGKKFVDIPAGSWYNHNINNSLWRRRKKRWKVE